MPYDTILLLRLAIDVSKTDLEKILLYIFPNDQELQRINFLY